MARTTIFRLVRTLEQFGAVREIEGQGYVLRPALNQHRSGSNPWTAIIRCGSAPHAAT